MSKPAFTPGPWVFAPERAPTSRGFCRIVGSEAKPNRRNLVHVMGLYCDAKGVEADANARLIAAAPALYDAVEALVECFIKRGPFDEPLGSSEQAPSINAGIAALKQARGEL